jgi:hypothetical protein
MLPVNHSIKVRATIFAVKAAKTNSTRTHSNTQISSDRVRENRDDD